MNDLVSIITPSYGSENFISNAIDSVIGQLYKGWEMVIVDDLSPDNSNNVIEDYVKKDSRIKLIKLKKNSGPALARNTAIEKASGRYIAFLDADDLWKPEKLSKQIQFMNKNSLDFTYSSYDLIDEEGNDIGMFKTRKNISYKSMLKTSSVGCLTAIYDTKNIGKIYMPMILKRQDYGLWLKIMKKINTTQGMLESLAKYRIRKKSVSSNKFKAAKYQWKVYRELENLNFFQSMYYFSHYAYFGITKYK